jgi:hypothetical protein
MNRRDRDFVALYNALWYRDFPVTPNRQDINRRALWTTHIASTVKQSADLLGLFTCFETGGKTDAVIEDATGRKWAKVEWEWIQPHAEGVNEIDKLAGAVDEADTFIFIGYSRIDGTNHSEMNIEKITKTWGDIDKPLIAILVTFSRENGTRRFQTLQTHLVQRGKHKKLREQPALPWEAAGTKWDVQAQQSYV